MAAILDLTLRSTPVVLTHENENLTKWRHLLELQLDWNGVVTIVQKQTLWKVYPTCGDQTEQAARVTGHEANMPLESQRDQSVV